MPHDQVYNRADHDGPHPQGLPWVFEWEGEDNFFATEDEACTAQRDARAAHGLDPMTGASAAPTDDGWTAAELQRIREKANNLECLLAQAVEDWPQFDGDSAPLSPGCIAEEAESVDGGDLVEWFGEWRARVKATLNA